MKASLSSIILGLTLVVLSGCSGYTDKRTDLVPGATPTDKFLKGTLLVGSQEMPVLIAPSQKSYELSYNGLLFRVSYRTGKEVVTVVNPGQKWYVKTPTTKVATKEAPISVDKAFRQDLWGDRFASGDKKDKLQALRNSLKHPAKFPNFFATPCEFSAAFLERHSQCDAKPGQSGEQIVRHGTSYKHRKKNAAGRPTSQSENWTRDTVCHYNWDYGIITSCQVDGQRGGWNLKNLTELPPTGMDFDAPEDYTDLAVDYETWLPDSFGTQDMGQGGFKLGKKTLSSHPRLPQKPEWRLLQEEWNSDRGRVGATILIPAVSYTQKQMKQALKSYVEENAYNSFLLDFTKAEWKTLEQSLKDEETIKKDGLRFTQDGLYFHLRFENFGDKKLDIPNLARAVAGSEPAPELAEPDPAFLEKELVKFPIADESCFKIHNYRVKSQKPRYSWFQAKPESRIRKGNQDWSISPTNWYRHRVDILAWNAELLNRDIDWPKLVQSEGWPEFYRKIDWKKCKKEADFVYYKPTYDKYILLRDKTMLIVKIVESPHGQMREKNKLKILKDLLEFKGES